MTLPHTDEDENFMCVLRGWKKFTIISPFERERLYAGLSTSVPSNYSPVDFV